MAFWNNILSSQGGPTDAMGQSEDDRKLVSHIKEKVEQIRSSANRQAHEAIWMTNIAYLCGHSNLRYDSQTRSFIPSKRNVVASRFERYQINKILPTVQNRLARLAKNAPRYDIRPETSDSEDKEAARLGLQILTSLWDQLQVNEKRIPLYMWLQECGHSWIKVSWDVTKGKFMEDGEREGDVRIDIVSPFEVFPDPLAKYQDEMQYLIQCKVRKLDYFKDHYEKGSLVKEEGTWLMSAQFEQRLQGFTTRPGSSALTDEAMKNTAIEMVKYEAPSKNYPNGRMIIAANGVLLEDKELPVGEIPFAKFDDIIIAGKMYPEAVITHLRPIQDHINENARRRMEWVRKLLSGKLIAAKGHGINQESVNDEVTEIIEYNPNPNAPASGMPQAMQMPNIPQYAYNEDEISDGYINYISGISDVSRGQLPSASIPAIGAQLLVEQDETRIGVMTTQHEFAWAKVGRLLLKFVENFYVMPRKLKIAGRNLEYAVKDLTGDMLRGNTDVYVIPGSTLPGSKTLKRQEILNAYNQGLLGDPADMKVREKVLQMIEFGDTQDLWVDYGLDMAQIREGIKNMEMGEVPEYSDYDNHALWCQEINRYRKADKFKALAPEIQQLFIAVMEMHFHAITNAMTPDAPPQAPPPPPVDPAAMAEQQTEPPPQPMGA